MPVPGKGNFKTRKSRKSNRKTKRKRIFKMRGGGALADKFKALTGKRTKEEIIQYFKDNGVTEESKITPELEGHDLEIYMGFTGFQYKVKGYYVAVKDSRNKGYRYKELLFQMPNENYSSLPDKFKELTGKTTEEEIIQYFTDHGVTGQPKTTPELEGHGLEIYVDRTFQNEKVYQVSVKGGKNIVYKIPRIFYDEYVGRLA